MTRFGVLLCRAQVERNLNRFLKAEKRLEKEFLVKNNDDDWSDFGSDGFLSDSEPEEDFKILSVVDAPVSRFKVIDLPFKGKVSIVDGDLKVTSVRNTLRWFKKTPLRIYPDWTSLSLFRSLNCLFTLTSKLSFEYLDNGLLKKILEPNSWDRLHRKTGSSPFTGGEAAYRLRHLLTLRSSKAVISTVV